MKRFLVTAAAGLATLFVVGCSADTDPATNVSYTDATLNGTYTWNAGDGPGELWMRYRKQGTSPWTDTAHSPYPQMGSSGSADISIDVHNLDPGSPYQFVACGSTPNGSSCFDSNGNANGSAYDTFTTTQVPTVTPNSAKKFRDSIGMNTRLAYSGPYGNCTNTVLYVTYMGIRFLRDGIWPSTDNQWNCFHSIAANTNIKFTFGIN